MSGWTDERVERLRQLWADGRSCSQIAAQLGGVSRNAIIGKVHRIGLAGRAKPAARYPRKRPPRPRPTIRPKVPQSFTPFAGRPKAAPVARPRVESPTPPASARVSLMDLAGLGDMPGTCRWPLGEPAGPSTLFCGAGREDIARPYCEFHERIACSDGRPSPRPARENAGAQA